MEYVIEISGLCKKYDGFELKDVSLKVPQGGIMGFIGQNGAGKTTTIYSILNIIRVDGGDIRVFGLDSQKEENKIKEDIGVVFDEMGYHEVMSPYQINKMMKHIYKNWDENVFFSYLEKFGLPLKKKCGKFSRGMRMKLQIAVALSHKAKLLIMDEPTSGLDPIVRNEILDIFQEYVENEEHTILLSSHIIGDLERIADEIAFINKGKILISDSKDRILENHGMIKVKKDQIDAIDETDIVAVKKHTYGADILVKDPEKCKRKYSDFLVESATLEDIMLFYISREQKTNNSKVVEK